MPSKRKPPPKKASTSSTKPKTAATIKKTVATPIRKSTRKPVQFVPFTGEASTPKSKPKAKGATKSAKKPKVESKAATTKKGTTKKAAKKSLKVAKGKVTKKTAVKKEPKEKKVKAPRIKNDKLKPRPEIDILEQNPIIHGKGKPGDPDTLETVIRLVYRWTYQQDITNLKKLANDWKHFPTNGFELRYSPFDSRTPEFIALQNGNKKLFDAIRAAKKDAQKQREKRPAFEINSLLQKMTTGQANIHMLGHRTAKIEATRGGRQGNNALILFDDLSSDMETGKKLIDSGVSFEMLAHADELLYSKDSLIYRAVRAGHRKLAASMIEAWAKYNFNDLHINTLKFDKQPLPKFMPISTTKKALGNKKITPVHTAAINPNVEYLKAILAVEPVFNQPDTDNWYTIHYAAVCEGPAPLKYLIERGAPLSILNKNKESPLHCAARAGRLENVKVIIEALQKEKLPEAVDEDAIIPKKSKTLSHFGNMLNAKTKVNETPLHYAVKYEHLEVVKYLLKQPEIIVDAAMSAGAEKLTPLILAAQKGNLAILRTLIDEGHAFMDLGDKFKRTPLIHATIGGHPHIVAELLRRGASINSAPDSSGNTAAHYASAYSWSLILRFLEKAEPTCLTQINSWHLTPLCVAFLKNHMDIVAYLLDEDHGEIKISVNDCDNEGNTLLMLVLKHESTIGEDKNLIAKIEYLIENGADVEIKSATGQTAFHYFASKRVVLKATKPAYGSAADANKKRFTKDEYFKIVELLTGDKKAEIAGIIDDSGNTVLEEALEQGNILLAEKVFEWTKKEAIERWTKNLEQNEIQTNILHLIFDAVKIVYQTSNSFEYNLGFLKLFENIAKEAKAKTLESGKTLLQALAEQFDKNGRTPLIYILREIKQFRVPASTTEGQVQTDEIRKIILQVVELARAYLKIDKESAFVREKPKKKDDTSEQNQMQYGAFGFRHLLGSARKQKHKNSSSKEEPYYPSAFELSLRFWVVGYEEGYALKENKLKHRNPLLKMMVEELKENGLLEKALLDQDEKKGFKGYSPLLFCIQNDVKDSTTFILKIAEDLKITQKVCGQILEKVFDHEKNEYKTVNKSALLLAVEKRNLLVAKYLAAYTDLASKVDESGRNALHYLSTSPENVVDFLDAIISRGAKPTADNFGRYPLHYAIGAIHSTASTDISTDNIEYLIKVNPESANKFDCLQRLPIHYAFIPIVEKEEKQFDYSQVPKADPIAVVVVILKHTKELSTPDIYGNTLIHYAAMAGSNICLLTLIDKCRDVNYKNKLSNIPLGLAVARSNESATMTLIQAGGDVKAKVFCLPPEPFKVEDEKWKWFPDRSAEQKQVSHTILSLVVRNGWQGIIYVILDKLNNQPNVLKNLCAAAIEHRQFNLAQTLLKKLKNDNSVKNEASILFEKLAEYCNIREEPASNLMRSLFSAGMLWQEYETANCKAAEIYAEKCDLQGLLLLKTLDQEFNNGQNWHEHLRSRGSLQILKNLFKSWKGNLPKTEALRLLSCISEYAIACGNVSTRLFDFNKPAFDGMEHPRHKKPIPEKQNITPLIYAVQVRKYGLAEFLLSTLKVDVNAPDEMGRTALMHAIMSNDEQMIKILARMKHGHGTEIADASMMEVVVEDGLEENGSFHGTESQDDDSEDEDDDESEESENDDDEDGTEEEDEDSRPPPKKKAMLLARKSKVAKRKAPKSSKKTKKDKKFSLSFKNSKINVAASDAHGKNALHYLVEPNGYENIVLARELFKAETGFIPLITKNNSDGESPLSLASKLRQKDIFALFQSHVRKGQSNGFTASTIQDSSELPKTIALKSSHDFEKVSAEFVQAQTKSQQKVESEEEKEKRLRTPHHLVQNYDISEIVKDDEDGNLYSTLMHKTDVQYGFQGYHNYYRIQLVQRKGGANLYVLFTHWGRIGDPTGQCQHTPFSDKEAATKEFKSIFKAKSGNEWGQEFEEKPNKYRLVEIDETKIDLSELKIELKSTETAKDPVYEVIKDVSDVEWMKRKWKTVCSQAANAIPFGQAKREKILKAKAILDQLRPLVAKFETDRYSSNADPMDALQKITKTGKLTNEFYTELALGSFAYSALPVIDNNQTLGVYDKLIEQMLEFEIAGKLLTAAAGQKEMDPFKYIKDCIECDIKPIDSESLEAQRILQYIRNSAQNVKVTGIYSVLSKAGVEFFDEKGRKAKNHKYLWHGTKPENLLSILKLGLLATPPHAIQTGNLFGEGIYFAETFVKSYNYCTESSKGQKYALLCEVALGTVFTSSSLSEMTTTSSADAKSKDTLKIAGKNIPNDKFEVTAPTGVRLPLGEMQRNEKLESNWGAMDYSEYIVKDRSNVIIRYLVSFE